MRKTLLILVLVAIIGWLAFILISSPCPPGTMVFQMAVDARNIFTGEIKQFGTICQVPWGWELVGN